MELERLATHGRPYLSTFLSETGYDLGNNSFGWEGFPPINEQNRADYMARAFRDHWHAWPEVAGVAPYELLDPQGVWTAWDWMHGDGSPRPQFNAVAALDKSAPQQPSVLRIVFRATAASAPGVYPSQVSATAGNASVAPLPEAATVTVLGPLPTPTPTATSPAPPSATPTPTPTDVGTPAPPPLLAPVAVVRVGLQPHGLAVDPARRLVYVTGHAGGGLHVLDADSLAVLAVLPTGGSLGANGVALDLAAGRVAIAHGLTNDVVLRPEWRGSGPVQVVAAGASPLGLAVESTAGHLAVANFGGDTVTWIDGRSGQSLAASTVGSQPSHVVHSPLLGRFFVSVSGEDRVVALEEGPPAAVVWSGAVGGSPYGLALDDA